METVQVAMSNGLFAKQLRTELERNTGWSVVEQQTPNLGRNGLVILDQQTLDRLVCPVSHPERIVLVTRNDPGTLDEVWAKGIRSVVFETDSPRMAALAAMGLGIRLQAQLK